MPRLFDPSQDLIIASHNEGKVSEFRQMLGTKVHQVISAKELNLDEPEETGTSFQENAQLKALAAAQSTGKVCLADDSGLIVTELGDRPGIYSARWAGADKNYQLAMDKIDQELAGSDNRQAYFTVSLCLAWPDGHCEFAEGRVNGTLRLAPAGTNGMGYDPWFQAEGYTITFAEMDKAEKSKLSHRGRALSALLENYFVK